MTRDITYTVPPGTPSGTRLAIPIVINSTLGTAGPLPPNYFLVVGQPVVGLTQNFDASASLPTGWTTASTGAAQAWTISTVNPDSPTRAAAATNVLNVGTTDLITPAIPVTTGSAKLTFRTAFNLEAESSGFAFYDGMVLEVSVNGGAFIDIIEADGIFLSGGYNGTIEFFDNPLATRNAWSGLSGGTTADPGYISVAVQLPASMNGKSVKFRWRVGTDSSIAAPGLAGVRIDNVSLESGTTFTGPSGPPVVTATAGDLTFAENQAPTAIDPGLTVTDVDTPSFSGASVSITSGFAAGEDSLGFSDQGGITGAYDSSTGVLTLSGSATVAAYETALRSVTFINPSEDPSSTQRIVTFSIMDGTGVGTATRNVNVLSVNDAPTLAAIPPLPSIPGNSPPQSVDLAGISAGGENQIITVTATSSNPLVVPDPVVTYLTPSETGSITFGPLPGQSGDALITVTVTDSGGTANGGVDSASRTLLVRIGEINDPPSFVKGADVSAARGGGAQVVTGWATAISPGPPDEANQTVNFIVQSNNAALFQVQPAVDSSGTLTFTPSSTTSGLATITVTAQDNGGTADGGVDTSPSQTFVIAVTSFSEEIGGYAGLILPAAGGTRDVTRTGSIGAKLSSSGKFSGKLVLAGKRFGFKGKLGDDGVARFGKTDSPTLELKRKRATPLTLALTVDVGLGTDTMTGTIKDGASDFAVIDADRIIYTSKRNPTPPLQNPPASLLGSYTVVLPAVDAAEQGRPATEYPQGDAFGRIVIGKSGAAKLSGRLADGSKFGGSAPVAKSGRWPFYDSVGKGGAVEGFAFFRSTPQTDIDGENFLWIRPASSKARQYPAGWPTGIFVDAAGSKYLGPSKRNPAPIVTGLGAVDLNGNAELTFTAGGLPGAGLVQPLVIDIKNKVLALAPTLGKVKVKLSGKSGSFSGEFQDSSGNKLKFGGAVLQKQKLGRGSFTGTTQIGLATLTPDNDPGVVSTEKTKPVAEE